ncbi:hypothetical protein RvY_18560 [Ramazzottius varieornatus]|uniref:Protein aurora borealis n=1 Tax=Ramazzottius varieornatus TaxID=947166 RepID=A0A1D1W675_RAMVA|nr:hypothetical protein RvY_18560 [Ramazzottius varieornatus]
MAEGSNSMEEYIPEAKDGATFIFKKKTFHVGTPSSVWENEENSNDWYTSPDVMRDRDASDTILNPDILGSTFTCDSPELKDTPDLVEGKPKFFRRRAITVLRKKVLKATPLYQVPSPHFPLAPDSSLKSVDGFQLESPGMSPISQAGSGCNFMASQSSDSLSQQSSFKNSEPLRFISTPTDPNRAMEEYNRGPNISAIDASFISCHEENTDSEGSVLGDITLVDVSKIVEQKEGSNLRSDKEVQTSFVECYCACHANRKRANEESDSHLLSSEIPVHKSPKNLHFVY